ncbi:MAG: class I adenylate-forming enzyme family protein [Lautropia sp.]
MNIQVLLQMAADAMGERVAAQVEDAVLTNAGLQAGAAGAAGWLAAQAAERVAYLGLNGLALPVALFASAMAGRPFVPLNYRLADQELQALVARCAPAVLIADPQFAHRVNGIEGILSITCEAFMARAAQAAPLVEPRADSNDVAVQLFTSGTTGTPKAALLRHCHLSSYILESVEFMGADATEAQLVTVPPYHIAGVSSVLSSVHAGRRSVILPSFTPEAWVALASREKVTHAMVVPTMLGRVLAELERTKETLPYLRHLAYGGGRMPLPVIRKAMERLPHVGFVNAYGLTETSSTIAVLGPQEHRDAIAGATEEERARLGSVGRPLPTLELSIRDPDGARLPAGTAGEIWVRGSQVSGEYLGQRSIRKDGWLPTRDAGWLDSAGFLFVDGRLDDVIVRGGENLSPGEIEDVLLRHSAVSDAAVIGVPDVEWGESVVAVVVARQGSSVAAGELKDWVRAALRSAKTPELVIFRDALPYNETGKLLRRTLREEITAARAATSASARAQQPD